MTNHQQTAGSLIPFWLSAWLGTTLAGGIFGLLMVGCAGAIMGCCIAGLLGALVQTLGAFLTWCFWLRRYRVVMAALAGALIGIISTLAVTLAVGVSPFGSLTFPLAGFLGALGGGLGGGVHWWYTRADAAAVEPAKTEPWQFTLREMFLHVTVFSVLLALVTSLVVAVQGARESGRQAMCENNLRQLAICLQYHQATHEGPIPVFSTDENGRPTLSWRVKAIQHVYYDYDFSAKLDFAKPWSDPANLPFLNSLPCDSFQCPSLRAAAAANTTHYVALTGPGTYWTETGQIDENSTQDAILVIEWPPSNIHWAEPRDITPDEFLAWFESRKSPPHRIHPGGLHYIDARGEVCTLPWDIGAGRLRRILKPHQNGNR